MRRARDDDDDDDVCGWVTMPGGCVVRLRGATTAGVCAVGTTRVCVGSVGGDADGACLPPCVRALRVCLCSPCVWGASVCALSVRVSGPVWAG